MLQCFLVSGEVYGGHGGVVVEVGVLWGVVSVIVMVLAVSGLWGLGSLLEWLVEGCSSWVVIWS